jgi:hypothetical protein
MKEPILEGQKRRGEQTFADALAHGGHGSDSPGMRLPRR